ncbi:uncharacterized protein LOC113568030 [Electrophorus electricus]|uniref:uncharacterized protein LOC113568030 n=1 Tax=Electrophorus electricus TaxID=8005 RepID=UPI0015D0A572|nr:uncharacterized protein LOC113568030 [Electrophorus electricus]
MDVNVSEPVEVILNRTDDTKPNTVRLCELDGREIQCVSEYEKRVSFRFRLQLKDLKESDSGLYTIRDTRNDEVIGTYTVIVGVLPQGPLIPAIKVNPHDAATLPCNQVCSGLVTWTMHHKPGDILAQCYQTSCQSKEGFYMSHDQYLKGDLSLTITDVEFNKRAWYTCSCNSETICDWTLQVHAFSKKIHVLAGESLSMDVPISEPVELNKTDDTKPNTVRLCEIRGHEIQCVPEYEKRVSFSSSLQLKDLKESDSGVYTIRDTRNDEVIATYTITTTTVEGRKEEPDTDTVEQELEKPDMLVLAVVLSLVLVVILVLLVLVIMQRFQEQLQNCCLQMNVQTNECI